MTRRGDDDSGEYEDDNNKNKLNLYFGPKHKMTTHKYSGDIPT
jgi:hypothetical protein